MSVKSDSIYSGLTPAYLTTVPHLPGVYLMRDKDGVILYVGKAKDLKKRLSSYSHFRDNKSSKTRILLTKVAHVETIITDTEKEAFILEASFIKKNRPRYNILLRDDKNYPLIKVTLNEEWPRMFMTRRRSSDGARYFGPYSSSASMWETIRFLNKLFPLRRCKGKKLQKRERPCLNFQMNQCLAPCLGKITKEKYLRVVDNILAVLSGKNRELIKRLSGEMQIAADTLDFELAAELRDTVASLQKTMEKQIIVSGLDINQDVFSIVREGDVVAVSILHIRKGVINGHKSFYLGKPIGYDLEIMNEVLKRFYSDEQEIPENIFVSVLPDECESLKQWLSEKKVGRVNLKMPQRGDGRQLLAMAEKNARHIFADRAMRSDSWDHLSAEMHKRLKLDFQPERVICLDISNIGGKQSVGAVVSFFCGEKEKSRYRHYKIKTVTGPDDYASMREVLTRHLKQAEKGDFLPSLLVVDGGRGQLGMAVSVVNELNLQGRFSLAGIAKEKGDKGEKIYRPCRKNPIILAGRSPILLFLMKVRDESHRFGITFHRKWRQKETLTSELDEIPGVGPVRRAALLKEIGSLSRIQSATIEDLARVPGISLALAEKTFRFFQNKG